MELRLSTLLIFWFCWLGSQEASAQELSEQLQQESVEKLVSDARAQGDAVQGAILFAQKELGCANCHARGSGEAVGPDLSQRSEEMADRDLIEALLYPSRKILKGYETSLVQTDDGETVSLRVIRKGDEILLGREITAPYRLRQLRLETIEDIRLSPVSSMPDNLVDQLNSRQEFLDLVRYLIEMKEDRSRVPDPSGGGYAEGRNLQPHLAGLVLLDELNCRACHERAVSHDGDVYGVPPRQAPRLDEVGSRVDPEYLIRFIMDPSSTEPGTSMPHMLNQISPEARRPVAEEITHFLVSMDSQSPFTRETREVDRAKRGEALFHEVGCVACHAPRSSDGKEMEVSASVSLGGLQEKYSIQSLTRFLEDPLQVRPDGRMPNMKLDHFEAEDLAHYLAGSLDLITSTDFVVDMSKAAKGRSHFQELGCSNCHSTVGVPPLDAVSISSYSSGCLSQESGRWPRYDITRDEKSLLAETLSEETPKFDSRSKIELAMATLNCYACHPREGLGGVSLERDPFFQTADFNLGPQGRLPPDLTGVGDKLNAKWIRQVLVSGRSIRPYMKTRMPQYGASNLESLLSNLVECDDRPARSYPELSDRRETRKTGQQLVGNQGLNCIACHTYQLNPSETMSAVDLTEMHERLQRDWFEAYMRDPQSLSPNTVMPSFWPGGRSIRSEILEGNADRQIEAIWTYLADGRQAGTPRGLKREPIELLATDEAVMLRRAYPGVGKRGIGIGYPAGVNIVFDAEQLRLAMFWKGKFADPSGVWRSQGHGQVRPLGQKVLQLSKGPELFDPQQPWNPESGRPLGYRFQGYRLDEKRRPEFRYTYQGMRVTDFFKGVRSGETEVTLKRSLTFESQDAEKPLVFRLLRSRKVEQFSENRFETDEGLTIELRTDEKWELVEVGDQMELQVQLVASKPRVNVEVLYSW